VKRLRIPLRAVLYQENGHWIAHCLELDLLGDGETQQEAQDMLGQAILTQLQSCMQHKAMDCFFRPADPKYFGMYAAGEDVANVDV
jgi:hypothetical protein